MTESANKHQLSFCFQISRWQLTINLWVLAVFVVVLYGLLRLGMWQYDRSNEKQNLIDEYKLNSELPFKQMDSKINEVIDYQNIGLVGKRENNITVYVANESYKGRDGYHILNPVILENKYLLWVNRGWVAALPDRRNLPKIELPPTLWQIKGQAYFSKGKPILFEHALQEVNENQWLIQALDYSLLATVIEASHIKPLPYIIRLAEEEEFGFIREWQFNTMPPSKHLAYSVQWFGLALAWSILMGFVSLKRKDR